MSGPIPMNTSQQPEIIQNIQAGDIIEIEYEAIIGDDNHLTIATDAKTSKISIKREGNVIATIDDVTHMIKLWEMLGLSEKEPIANQDNILKLITMLKSSDLDKTKIDTVQAKLIEMLSRKQELAQKELEEIQKDYDGKKTELETQIAKKRTELVSQQKNHAELTKDHDKLTAEINRLAEEIQSIHEKGLTKSLKDELENKNNKLLQLQAEET